MAVTEVAVRDDGHAAAARQVKVQQLQNSRGQVLGRAVVELRPHVADEQPGTVLEHSGQLELGQVAVEVVRIDVGVFERQPASAGVDAPRDTSPEIATTSAMTATTRAITGIPSRMFLIP